MVTSLETAINLQKSGHYAEAEAAYRGLLTQLPESSEVRFLLAVLMLNKNEITESSKLLGQAIELDPDIPDYLMLRGEVNFLQGDLPAARIDYQQAKSLTPFDPAVYCGLGNILIEAGRLDEAEIEFKYVINRQPNNSDACIGMSRIFCQRGAQIVEKQGIPSVGQAELAKKLFADAVAYDLTNAIAIRGLAETLILLKQKKQAVNWLLKYIELGHSEEKLSPYCRALLFIEALHQDNPIFFRQTTKAIIEANSAGLPRLTGKDWQRLNLTLTESKNREPARNYLEALYNHDMANVDELLELAKIESACGNQEKALHLTLYASRKPTFDVHQSGLAGRILFDNGETELAQEFLLTALQYRPDDKQVLFLLSKLSRELGRKEDSNKYIKSLATKEQESHLEHHFFCSSDRLRNFVDDFRQQNPFPIDVRRPNNTLIHYHIGRSGGIALKAALSEIIPPEHYYSCSEGTREPPVDQLDRLKAAPDIFKRSIRMAYTHHYLPVHTALNQEFTYFTFFRDPVERLVSQFYLERNRNPAAQNVRSFNIFVDWYAEQGEQNSWTNSIIRLIPQTGNLESNSPISKFELAKNILDQYFSFIGINAYFQQSFFILCMLMRAEAVCTVGRKNTSPGKRDAVIDRATRTKIESIFDLDLEFYELYENRFEERYADVLNFEVFDG
tara:strand:+ start:144 stop:2165 length:2022 start_codon:yes stop_codon:yes gene_type:complete